jgi:menaquinone-dependent protoporphyrinogen oxidase
MRRVLIVFSTVDGHTQHIAERLRALIQARGLEVAVMPLAECSADDLARCDGVVIGASIRYGHHRPDVAAFIARHRAALEARPNALFSVNVVARKPGKDRPETNPYLRKFLATIEWRPQRLEVFAGKIDYPRYRFFDRQMIRFIMWLTQGPTDLDTVVEFTDWSRVEAFGADMAQAVQGSVPAETNK